MTLDPRKLAAEFLGTLILVVVAVGVATESFGFKLFGGTFNLATGTGLNGSIAAGVVATALAFGLVLVALVYAIGPISGCHVNPAVTLGFIASGRMKLAEGVAYIVAQVIGGIAGAYLLYWMFTTSPLYNKSVQGLGTDGYGKKSILHVSEGGAFLIEVVLTAIFVVGRAVRHPQGCHSGRRRRGHRLRPGDRAPHRHSADGHLGEPGPEPRAGPRRGRHGAQPGLGLPGRPAGRRASLRR